MMLKNIVAFLTIIIFSSVVYGHCQIPCGIFDDETRIELMKEHVVTIEKSINELNKNPNDNQKVRWILNKENHADELSDIVTYYFMAQRVKESSDSYQEKLNSLHKILVLSMKLKLRKVILKSWSNHKAKTSKHAIIVNLEFAEILNLSSIEKLIKKLESMLII